MSKKPEKPKRVTIDDKELLISWNVPPSDLQAVDFFEVQWKKKEEKRWSGLKSTDGNSTSIAIPVADFEKNTTYQFKVKWTTIHGEDSQFSEISDGVLITVPRSPRQPGRVSSSQTKATSARLYWEKPKGADEVSYYDIQYRSCGVDQWNSVQIKPPTELLDLKDLKSKTDYEFKVRAIFSDGSNGPFSEVSDTVTTQESLAIRLKANAAKEGSAKPQRYKLKFTFSEQTTNSTAMTRKGRLGERDKHCTTKTIMVVGATGAGKSTLIDGMINYIVDVAWEDDFRFTMIDLTEDEKDKVHQQAISQTNWITCYEVNHQHGSRLDYNLNIVDTPGFGDTRGREQDKKIVDQIREFFTAPAHQGIDTIDAVCFITQAPLARLTDAQKYIFDSILSLFGKDIKDNIFALITFADGKEPPVLAALKEAKIPFQRHFTFNNDTSVDSTDSSAELSRIYWKFGTENFAAFFSQLNCVKQRSLKLSSEVLQKRKTIENMVERLSEQIEVTLQNLDTLKLESEYLAGCNKNIEDNKNFRKRMYVSRKRRVSKAPGQCVTNCKICEYTCENNCTIGINILKILCEVMKDFHCTVCPRKCFWDQHTDDSFYYETYTAEEENINDYMKEKYHNAVDDAKTQTLKLDEIKSAFKSKLNELLSLMKTVRKCITELEQGALKANALNEMDDIKSRIKTETEQKRPGWEGRVQILKEIIKKIENIQKTPNGTVLSDWTDDDIKKFLQPA